MVATSPFDEMERMFDEMREALSGARFAMRDVPGLTDVAVDVSRHDGDVVVVADLPGFEKSEIDLSVADGVLRIDATHHVEDDTASRRRHVSERVSLPDGVDVEEGNATYRNGVLEVRFPTDDVENHRIDID